MAATTRPSPEPEPLPDPSQAYATPEELADDEELTLEERAALLERWEADDIALQRAEDEGMAGGESPRLSRVARALALVRERLELAGAPLTRSPPGPPGALGA